MAVGSSPFKQQGFGLASSAAPTAASSARPALELSIAQLRDEAAQPVAVA